MAGTARSLPVAGSTAGLIPAHGESLDAANTNAFE
jgi:hypothetical protein